MKKCVSGSNPYPDPIPLVETENYDLQKNHDRGAFDSVSLKRAESLSDSDLEARGIRRIHPAFRYVTLLQIP